MQITINMNLPRWFERVWTVNVSHVYLYHFCCAMMKFVTWPNRSRLNTIGSVSEFILCINKFYHMKSVYMFFFFTFCLRTYVFFHFLNGILVFLRFLFVFPRIRTQSRKDSLNTKKSNEQISQFSHPHAFMLFVNVLHTQFELSQWSMHLYIAFYCNQNRKRKKEREWESK